MGTNHWKLFHGIVSRRQRSCEKKVLGQNPDCCSLFYPRFSSCNHTSRRAFSFLSNPLVLGHPNSCAFSQPKRPPKPLSLQLGSVLLHEVPVELIVKQSTTVCPINSQEWGWFGMWLDRVQLVTCSFLFFKAMLMHMSSTCPTPHIRLSGTLYCFPQLPHFRLARPFTCEASVFSSVRWG